MAKTILLTLCLFLYGPIPALSPSNFSVDRALQMIAYLAALDSLDEMEGYLEFINHLGLAESNNNYWAVSPSGTYRGRYQFGPLALEDININREKFLISEYYQEKAMLLYLKRNQQYLRHYIDVYVGKSINGVRITESGILASAHLVGQNSVKQFLRTNGQIVRRDGNNVSLEIYMERFGGYELNLEKQSGDTQWLFSLLYLQTNDLKWFNLLFGGESDSTALEMQIAQSDGLERQQQKQTSLIAPLLWLSPHSHWASPVSLETESLAE